MAIHPPHRLALREHLLAQREAFVLSAQGAAAQEALQMTLAQVIAKLAPQCLGVYWPIRFEFNAARPWRSEELSGLLPLALPCAQRQPRAMHYRHWDGLAPTEVDECGIATASGGPVAPDVLLVPCVGYTPQGHRLGYGGGYFDRYLAAHPHVTAIGVAWSVGEISEVEFAPQAHDQALMLVVTELGVVG